MCKYLLEPLLSILLSILLEVELLNHDYSVFNYLRNFHIVFLILLNTLQFSVEIIHDFISFLYLFSYLLEREHHYLKILFV